MASIRFFSFAPISRHNGQLHSDLASTRYRIIIPALQLARRGHAINLGHIAPTSTAEIDPATVPDDVVVFAKTLFPPAINLARKLRARGARIAFDLCDNYFNHDLHGTDYREAALELAALADVVITSTPTLQEQIRKYTGRDATIISDPVEGPRAEPRCPTAPARLRALWFGHPSNWNTVVEALPELAALAATRPLELTLITRQSDDVGASFPKLVEKFGGVLPMTFKHWHADILWPELAACDLVIIPSLRNEFHVAKSPNRVVESLWAGRPVIAHPLPSYLPFSDYAYIGRSLSEGILATLADPAATCRRIDAGQDYIRSHHSAWAIGNSWEEALGLRPTERVVRIQLACGKRILPGYINVDTIDTPGDLRPDLACKLDRLDPFANTSVDEILTVHALRQFAPLTSQAIYKECLRVLKPGGRLLVECIGQPMLNQQHAMLAALGLQNFKTSRVQGSATSTLLIATRAA